MATGPVVHCEGLAKRFGDVLAVEEVGFSLEAGEVLSVLGPSGSGKTTVLRLIAGFEPLDGGEIFIQGRRVSGPSVHLQPEHRKVGMVFQDYALFPHMTVEQNVSFGLRDLSGEDRRRRTAETIDLVGLDGLEARYPSQLSGGQQQRVALARTLAPRPAVLLLDEPFSNIDSTMRSDMRREVEAILTANDVATVFVTHDREEAFAVADRVGVMNEGRMVQLDSPEALYNWPASPFVAGMAGICDFLPGRVRAGVVETEVGKLPFTGGNGTLADGVEVDLMVRAEDLAVVADPRGLGTVRSREFRGDSTLLIVATPSGATLKCRQRSSSVLAPGTRVNLIFEKEGAFVAFERSEPVV